MRQRAGLSEWTVSGTNANGPLTLDVVLSERFKEFAMEGMAWYDIVNIYYWNKTKALQILNSQFRGLFVTQPNNPTNPTEWTFTKTSWAPFTFPTATEGNFLIPIPAIELAQAPSLQANPVDYP